MGEIDNLNLDLVIFFYYKIDARRFHLLEGIPC